MITLVAVLVGYLLDLIFGEQLAAISPAVLAGRLISFFETHLRARLPKTPGGETFGGFVMTVTVCLVFFTVPAVALIALSLISPILAGVLEAFWAYQILATRGLADASNEVRSHVERHDLVAARTAVGMIVGRDVNRLDEEHVCKAAVESVAENASDASVAPLLYLFIGGAPLGMLYKAINTMDSMVGYKNEKYRHFGRASARLDDVANLIPARVCAILMIAACPFTGLDARGAFRVWKRDRYNHTSPNSGHPESAAAGALGVQLGGTSYYFGKPVDKPLIGDAVHPCGPSDIERANKLLFATSALSCLLFCCVRLCVFVL